MCPAPLGVRGRNSDNRLSRERIKWDPSRPFTRGAREELRLDLKAGGFYRKAATAIVVPFNSAAASKPA
jgi:hypothetical protein